jgi:hypothetical protein
MIEQRCVPAAEIVERGIFVEYSDRQITVAQIVVDEAIGGSLSPTRKK